MKKKTHIVVDAQKAAIGLCDPPPLRNPSPVPEMEMHDPPSELPKLQQIRFIHQADGHFRKLIQLFLFPFSRDVAVLFSRADEFENADMKDWVDTLAAKHGEWVRSGITILPRGLCQTMNCRKMCANPVKKIISASVHFRRKWPRPQR